MKALCLEGLDTLAASVVTWQSLHGRHHLPWQGTTDPYRIWLSEIMLQQTQVATVIGYYERFLHRFPTVSALGQADQADVMPYWAGLGYYARARNLHRCAQLVHTEYGGRFPTTSTELATLPGIGRSTAAAIAAFAYGERSPIMDGNVKRVFTRYFGIYGETFRRAVETVLWETAQSAIDLAPNNLDIRRYTQGQMDLGATLCTRRNPDCGNCPLQTDCYAQRHAVQHSLPQPRARKTLPQRHCTMLILEHENSILLQQQPSPGIWGGLWSLPKFDDTEQMHAALTHWQLDAAPIHPVDTLTHTFSHFKLHIQPQHVVVQTRAPQLSEFLPAQSWTPLDQLATTALPAPVKTLLSTLHSSKKPSS